MGLIKYFAVALFLVVEHDCQPLNNVEKSVVALRTDWFQGFAEHVNTQSRAHKKELKDYLSYQVGDPTFQGQLDKEVNAEGSSKVEEVRTLYASDGSSIVTSLRIAAVTENGEHFYLHFHFTGGLRREPFRP